MRCGDACSHNTSVNANFPLAAVAAAAAPCGACGFVVAAACGMWNDTNTNTNTNTNITILY